eukprot:gene9629-11801_t
MVYGGGSGNQEKDLFWIKLKVNSKALYGKFMRKAIVDRKFLSIRNELLPTPANNSSQGTNKEEERVYIGINIPFYVDKVTIDPDFSYIIDVNSDDDDPCKKSGLTTGQIAGIVV